VLKQRFATGSVETGPDNLPLVVQVFRPNEANNTVYQERVEGARHTIGTGLQGELVHPVVSVCRQRATLTGLEVHDIIPDPGNVSGAVMIQDPLLPFTQHTEVNTETGVGSLGAGDRLKKQVYWCAALQAGKLRADMCQATGLRGNSVGIDQTSKTIENVNNRFNRFGCRVDSDDRIASAEQQPVHGGKKDTTKVVGRVVGL
jgi:hypothetical protein